MGLIFSCETFNCKRPNSNYSSTPNIIRVRERRRAGEGEGERERKREGGREGEGERESERCGNVRKSILFEIGADQWKNASKATDKLWVRRRATWFHNDVIGLCHIWMFTSWRYAVVLLRTQWGVGAGSMRMAARWYTSAHTLYRYGNPVVQSQPIRIIMGHGD